MGYRIAIMDIADPMRQPVLAIMSTFMSDVDLL